MNYTIIIPHKNIPLLLQHCLDSIPHRDDIQIIVVDDNSDENIVDFENFPGQNSERVEVYLTKEGRGAGYARNVGLKHAKGKWILFADADDIFDTQFLTILDEYIDSNYHIVYFGVNGFNIKDMSPSYRKCYADKLLEEAKKKNDFYIYYFGIFRVWGKLFLSDHIKEHDLSFEETIVANDRMFSVQAVHYAKQISFDERKIYTSYNRSGSLVTKKDSKSEMERLHSWCRINTFLKQNDRFQYRVNILRFLIEGAIHSRQPKMFIKGLKEISKYDNIVTFKDFIGSVNYVFKRIKNLIYHKPGTVF